MSPLTRKLIFLSLCFYGYLSIVTNEQFELAMEKCYGGKFEFLTIISLFITILTLIISILDTFFSLRYLKIVLLAIGFPVESLVTLYYWSIYFYDSNLVMPKDFKISFFTELCLHVFPAVALWLELLTMRNFKHFNSNFFFLFALVAGYYGWIHFLFQKNDRWVYPILELLDPFQRSVFFILSVFVICLFYLFGIFIYKQIN